MNSITNDIKIIKNETSKINEVDFENLTFGNTFTDHMLICDFENFYKFIK